MYKSSCSRIVIYKKKSNAKNINAFLPQCVGCECQILNGLYGSTFIDFVFGLQISTLQMNLKKKFFNQKLVIVERIEEAIKANIK